MSDPFFFGYGSLVNAKTHSYTSTHPATLNGWQRVWRHTSARDLAFLSVTSAPGAQIKGLIAKVPDADWDALDIRETGYFRSPLDPASISHSADAPDIEIYQTHPSPDPTQPHPILLSYIDVVVQGFLEVFGEDGAAHFFDTTQGWDAPVLNDRSTPQYPRAQTLEPAQTALVDHHLARLSARVENT